MYASVEEEALERRVPGLSALDGFVLTVLVFLLFWFGVYPAPLLRLISGMLPL
jgi:NADH:ubiquinone oxidoreductase subunit 4 (subunit M)